jgi:hypothetical protein
VFLVPAVYLLIHGRHQATNETAEGVGHA